MTIEIFSIGVFNSTESEFFDKLTQNKINLFCDIRQRRGVRGSKYAFVNSKRLQQKLADLHIAYSYIQELAPPPKIRLLQKESDRENKEINTKRRNLGEAFVNEYRSCILKSFNHKEFIEYIEQNGALRIVFFCVEEHPEACHRSLVTEQFKNNYNYKITHL